MTLDPKHLREICEKATPGIWVAHKPTADMHAVRKPSGGIIADVGYSGTEKQDIANAEYIETFNPQTIRELLDRLDALEGFLGLISHLKYGNKIDIKAISGGAKLLLEKAK